MLILQQVAVEQHLSAARALGPEVLGDIALARESAHFGTDEVGEPVHGRSIYHSKADRSRTARAVDAHGNFPDKG